LACVLRKGKEERKEGKAGRRKGNHSLKICTNSILKTAKKYVHI
jgi:hypothetical protein